MTTVFLCLLMVSLSAEAQDAAPQDRNEVNTRTKPGDMMFDSPVTFPERGALPSKFPPDVKVERFPAEEGYFIFESPCRSLDQIRAIQASMPSGEFTPPPNDWKNLERTRQVLIRGGELTVLALGDSIVNDTMRSGWITLLREAYPKTSISTTVYVRGGGGNQHFREQNRVREYIVPRKPNLVLIGGISQRSIEATRDVVRQLREELPDSEVLLFSGTFGTTDPRDVEALKNARHSGTGEYGRRLKTLAAEEKCAYLDMTTPWAEYIVSSGRHPHVFYRDVVHANAEGEQILAKIMMAFWKSQ